ncbi:MAG: fibronectin type III domain-containing protein [Candidatus Latescibacterota bacterium]
MKGYSHRRLACLAGLLLLAACHEAPRNNPLDPVSTSPVELSVVLDDTAGTAALTWTPYAGTHPFAEYRVVRKVQGMEADTVLAAIPDPDQTSYTDSTLAPRVAYQYRVVVVNASGFAAPSAWQSVGGYTVGAVELLPPEPDSLAGTLTLRWRSFQGPNFAAYQVFRRRVGTDRGERLAEVRARGDTSWVDAGPLHGVSYAYAVVVQAAGEELPGNDVEGRLALPPVTLGAAFESRTATAALAWTPYRGPRFQAYEVRRSTVEEASHRLLQTGDSALTSFVDSSLLGATEYRYEVVVLTQRGEEVPSGQASGAIHRQVGEWPLDVEGEGISRDHVRLYARPDGRIAALVTTPRQVRLHLYDPQGRLLAGQVVVDEVALSIDADVPSIADPRSASAAWSSSDGGVLAFAGQGPTTGLAELSADGLLEAEKHELFAGALPEPLTGDERVVQGEIRLVPCSVVNGRSHGVYDNVEVSAQGRVLFRENFADFPLLQRGAWQPGAEVQGWALLLPPNAVGSRYPSFFETSPTMAGSLIGYNTIAARRADPSWQDFRFEADVVPERQEGAATEGGMAIQIGGDA